jgi:hypothetical protein
MYANELFESFLSSLAETPRVWTKYPDPTQWTLTATAALVTMGQRAFPQSESAAKNHRDRFGRSEYLDLDVCVGRFDTWAAPLLVAEHENYVGRDKIQYCAWKLLATRATRRVLVAYYANRSDVPTAEAVVAATREVCDDNPGLDVLLFAGNWDATPQSVDDVRALFSLHIVGNTAER